MEGLGLIVMVGFGQAVWRGLFDRGAPLLWGAFDWAPGGWNGQMAVIGAISLTGLLIALVAHAGVRASRRRERSLPAGR